VHVQRPARKESAIGSGKSLSPAGFRPLAALKPQKTQYLYICKKFLKNINFCLDNNKHHVNIIK